MPKQILISITQAKVQLVQLIDQAIKGTEVIITKFGKPVVKLVPYMRSPT